MLEVDIINNVGGANECEMNSTLPRARAIWSDIWYVSVEGGIYVGACTSIYLERGSEVLLASGTAWGTRASL